MLYSLFVNYMSEIYFIYGLSFFVMGIAITLQNRRESNFVMAKSLWLLAIFSFIHGISEWGYFYIPAKAPHISPEWLFILNVIEISLIGVSFVFLLYFGIRLLGDVVKKSYFKYILACAISLTVFWVSYFVVYRLMIIGEDTGTWLTLADIFSRYFFGLPGGLLSAYAIYRQKDQVKLFGSQAVFFSIYFLAASFLGYALFAGLVVPMASFFPASYLNIVNVFQWTTIPVALIRTFFSLCITFSMLKVLELFQIERAAYLNKVVGENAVLMERERIKRDLHDGIIQSLYALGLQIKDGEYLLNQKRLDEAQIRLADSIENADQIIKDLRIYIQDLKSVELAGLSLTQLLNKVVRYCEPFDIEITVDNRVQNNICLATETKIHLYHILQELVTNVIKHAEANKVNLALQTKAKNLVIRIEDDGVGFNPEILRQKQKTREKMGLYNVEERIKSLKGFCEIKSEPGKGAGVFLEVPL